MTQLEYFFQCPHCWEEISMILDLYPETQDYIEDCEVCCNPIHVFFKVEEEQITDFQALNVQ